MPVGTTSGLDRTTKWLHRMAPDAEGNLPQGSTVIVKRQLSDDVLRAKISVTFDSIFNMETQVRQYIDAQGVSTLLTGHYLNFGRKLWKLTNRYSAETANIECQSQIALWVARGLNQTILEGIRSDVFGLASPVT